MKLYPALFFALFACSGPPKTKYDRDVQDIIIANIIESIGYGDSAKMHYRYPPIEAIDDTGYKRYYDSIKHQLDTSACYISLLDSIPEKMTIYDARSLIQEIKADGAGNISVIDNTLDTTIRNVFDVNRISAGVGLAVRIGSPTSHNKEPLRIALFGFSRMIMNTAHTKAAVFVSYICGSLCGYGELRLIEKKSGKWVVTKKNRTWIS